MDSVFLKALGVGLLCLIGQLEGTFAQKKLISNESWKSWELISDYGISNDGKYIWYSQGSTLTGIKTTIQSVDGTFREIGHRIMGSPKFTADSKYVLYLTSDTLNVLNLVSLSDQSEKRINNVRSFAVPTNDNASWITYQSLEDSYLLELASGKVKQFKGAKNIAFNDDGTKAVVIGLDYLDYLILPSFKVKRIYRGSYVNQVVFDHKGEGIAFCPITDEVKSLYYYEPGMPKAQLLVGKVNGQGNGQKISFRAPQFTRDSKRILFGLMVSKRLSSQDNLGQRQPDRLNIWHYKDVYPKVVQTRLNKVKETECAVAIDIAEKKLIFLEHADSTMIAIGTIPGNSYSITEKVVNFNEANWNGTQRKYQLVSLKDGSSKEIAQDAPIFTHSPKLSPKENFLSWYDYNRASYRIYEIKTGVVRDVTSGFPVQLTNYSEDRVADFVAMTHPNYWTADDKALLVFDQYDLWQIDPYGKKAPINITGGVGRRNGVTFRLTQNYLNTIPYVQADSLILACFNENDKKNGFCKVKLGKENRPNLSHMIDGLYYYPAFAYQGPKSPIKAKNSNRFLLQHMSATSAPNLCVTTDFKSFKTLTDIQPQKEYNWMTSELIKWNQQDGRELHGILYKPENFDPAKKYPVIFHYYDRSSHQLHQYRIPELSPGALDIPWYVSNGYLVFIPDLYAPAGHPAKGVIDAVESAVTKLKEFPWVDATKMGLEGHSFGGWETFVLAANTKHFAASQPSAGCTDFVSGYSSLEGGSGFLYEIGQNNMRSVPWEKPEAYIASSPIYKAGEVNAPMLIMHNKADGAVDFTQSRAMYVALRRQKKPVWMLEYIGEQHTIDDQVNQLDFAIRQQQFFGHYLKGEPMPLWMKEPGNLSLDLDTAKETN